MLILQGCNTYYVASNPDTVTLYADQNEASLAYTVPAGTALLVKGRPRNGRALVRYHDDPNWYWVAYTNFTLIPGFNPKAYAESYASYEGRSPGAGSYDATIQTGPRGGKYYINKNGKKTYVKRSTSSGAVKRVRGSRKH